MAVNRQRPAGEIFPVHANEREKGAKIVTVPVIQNTSLASNFLADYYTTTTVSQIDRANAAKPNAVKPNAVKRQRS